MRSTLAFFFFSFSRSSFAIRSDGGCYWTFIETARRQQEAVGRRENCSGKKFLFARALRLNFIRSCVRKD